MLKSYRGTMPTIAPDVFIEETAVIIGDVTIGPDSSVWFNSVVRGDVHWIHIGHRTNIQDLCLLHVTHDTYPLSIGDDVTVGHHVVLHGCTVNDRVLIGMGAIIMDGAVISEECIVGAGALVTERTIIPPQSLVLDSPAKVIRPLTNDEHIWLKQSAQNYVQYAKQYLIDSQNSSSKP
ncbi:MAG: gamma carbonic anhydrase family protein [Nitrospirales bacterium]|nr:gamma carbonic anhydrase family protein [Nitrospirales bacterium]